MQPGSAGAGRGHGLGSRAAERTRQKDWRGILGDPAGSRLCGELEAGRGRTRHEPWRWPRLPRRRALGAAASPFEDRPMASSSVRTRCRALVYGCPLQELEALRSRRGRCSLGPGGPGQDWGPGSRLDPVERQSGEQVGPARPAVRAVSTEGARPFPARSGRCVRSCPEPRSRLD